MPPTTLKTLAKALNISIATVSKALRNSYEISAETKEKVCALAKELKYEPNPSASNLRSHVAKTIAVIIPSIANNFFSLAIKGIEEVARQHDYHLLIYQTHEDSQAEIAFTNALSNGRVDGILISVSSNSNQKEHFTALINRIPVVFFDRVCDDMEGFKIITDDYDSSYEATCHLIDRECKNIAYLSALNNISTGKQRLLGYVNALKDRHVQYDERLVVTCDPNTDQAYLHIKELIQIQKPDGIISSIEELVLPCYSICQELQVKIPRDLKIVSFSNLNTAAILNPSLTTITQPAFEIGQKAADILFGIFSNKKVEPYQTIVLKSELIERDSSIICDPIISSKAQ
jgi:LacI family transcriptional regulator